jgi:hypothetical protein
MKHKTYKFATSMKQGTFEAKSMDHAKSIVISKGDMPSQAQIDRGAFWWIEDVGTGVKIGAGTAV